jgi:hypothetical protein
VKQLSFKDLDQTRKCTTDNGGKWLGVLRTCNYLKIWNHLRHTEWITHPKIEKEMLNNTPGKDRKGNLEKYFDPTKGPMCFNYKEWGHRGANCPKNIFTVQATPNYRDFKVTAIQGSNSTREPSKPSRTPR